MTISSTNPYDEKIIKQYESCYPKQVKEIIQDAEHAFLQWKEVSIKSRAKYMNKVAELLIKRKKPLALLMAEEMGKPITAGVAEIEKCARVCRYYAKHAASFLKNKRIETEAQKSYVTYHPLGAILAVMPWNFPFWQVMRFAAPTLMAGNTAILKHASNVPGCALAIEEIFMEAGLPKGVFTALLISSKEVKKVIKNKAVKAISLTGSGPAGKAVASLAAKHLKKSLLELGGNDAYLILADADLKLAAKKSVESRMVNAGQSCIGAKRIIVDASVYKPFLQLVKTELKKYKVGDPRKKETKIGPMARVDLRDEVHQQVTESVAKGAKLELGGKIPKRKGAFYPITVLTQVEKGMPAYDDEIFGPVVSILKVDSTEEAIRVANDSDFGLGAAIFSKDIQQAEQIAASQLQAGTVAINDFVRSDPRLPFGGVKQSGFGRELSKEGIMEFVNVKSVVVA